MTKNLTVLLILLSLYSCKKFDGEIRTQGNSDNKQSVFLINNSKDKKLKFTVKKETESENGKFFSTIAFYELEPGDEKAIGETLSFSEREYHTKIVYDTIREYQHLDKISKRTKTDIEIDKKLDSFIKEKKVKTSANIQNNYFTTYTKNGVAYDPTASSDGGINPFWNSTWKSIDTARNKKVQAITYLEPHVVTDSTKPQKRQKFIHTYEIKGQRIIN